MKQTSVSTMSCTHLINNVHQVVYVELKPCELISVSLEHWESYRKMPTMASAAATEYPVQLSLNTQLVLLKSEHCPHLLHTGGPYHFICPSCSINNKLEELLRLTRLWEKRGGPSLDYSTVGYAYTATRSCWITSRACLAKAMIWLERDAELERQWEKQNPGFVAQVHAHEGIRSAARALDEVRKKVPFLDWEAEDKVVLEKSDGKKRVSWDKDALKPAGRSPDEYRRTSEKYEPGRWASTAASGHLDTSFAYDLAYGTESREEELDREWELYQH
jgi:hypothetical protein